MDRQSLDRLLEAVHGLWSRITGRRRRRLHSRQEATRRDRERGFAVLPIGQTELVARLALPERAVLAGDAARVVAERPGFAHAERAAALERSAAWPGAASGGDPRPAWWLPP